MEEKVIPFDIDFSEGDNEVELPYKGMRKLTMKQQKNFPMIVTDSMVCQLYYISTCKRCEGCSFAINGCEKVVGMSAG